MLSKINPILRTNPFCAAEIKFNVQNEKLNRFNNLDLSYILPFYIVLKYNRLKKVICDDGSTNVIVNKF